jgi:hypothetical protein
MILSNGFRVLVPQIQILKPFENGFAKANHREVFVLAMEIVVYLFIRYME